MNAARPEKISIIGGGVAAIAAAYAITQTPDWQKRYEITVYQMGWRLGGKGASGRNLAQGGRIEEHGLHIWAGFYHNAFRLMKDCYQQVGRLELREPNARLSRFDEAFSGLDHFYLTDQITDSDGKTATRPVRIDFPQNNREPGSTERIPTPFGYFRLVIARMVELVTENIPDLRAIAYQAPVAIKSEFESRGLDTELQSPLHLLQTFVETLDPDARRHTASDTSILSSLLNEAKGWVTRLRQTFVQAGNSDPTIGHMSELTVAFLRGMVREQCFIDGFDVIDHWEIRDWLLHHGASKEAVNSTLLRGCYDYVFGFPSNIHDGGQVGAGTAIRGLLRLGFSYDGALFYKMAAGMGDTMFTPYYEVLNARGVKFKFFNAATRLVLSEDQSRVEKIEMVRQAQTKGGDYLPLVDVGGVPCWPSEPLWDQLENGAQMRADGTDFECEKNTPQGETYSLKAGEDFDKIILGASLGSLPYLAADLISASPRWRAMVDNVGTVGTQAAQFWMNLTTAELGWDDLLASHGQTASAGTGTVATGFTEPLNTWADMSDLLPYETWEKDGPKSIAYFCSPLDERYTDADALLADVVTWSASDLTKIWPDAKGMAGFDASVLHAPDATNDSERFAAQYYRLNRYGSERYVLSTPGSVQYRLSADRSGFDNLYLAGDWTQCGMNAGCVEAATISGMVAARGITGADIQIIGETDFAEHRSDAQGTMLQTPYAQTAPWPLTPMFSTGSIDGWFSFHAMDAEKIAAALPAGMRLHPQGITPSGTHPVTLLANRQTNVRPAMLPSFMAAPAYLEAIVAINYVAVDGYPGVYTYLANLYLDSRPPQLAGVALYGYEKRLGQLSMGASDYRINMPSGQPIWSGRYDQRGFAAPLSAFEGATIEDLCQQIIVSRHQVTGWHFSTLDFNLNQARIAPVSADVQIYDSTLADIPAGSLSTPPLTKRGNMAANRPDGLPGAFRISSTWTLSNPLDSKRLGAMSTQHLRLAG